MAVNPRIADRVRETSTSTGTGNFSLGGAVTSYRTFNSGIGAGNYCYYCIAHQTSAEWEVGVGYMVDATTLQRVSIIASSVPNNAIEFTTGTKDVFVCKPAATDQLVDPATCGIRLTCTAQTPVTTSDVTGATDVWTAAIGTGGGQIALWDGLQWQSVQLADAQMPVSGYVAVQTTRTGNLSNGSATVSSVTANTTGLYVGQPVTGTNVQSGTTIASIDSSSQITLSKTASGTSTGTTLSFYHANYDIFCYYDSGSAQFEWTGWTDNTTRATALEVMNGSGILAKYGDYTRRYLGTVRVSSTTTTEDSQAKRFVWNYYSRRKRKLKATDDTNSWSYTTTAYRPWNNSTGNRVEFVQGLSEDTVDLLFLGLVSTTTGPPAIGIGLDSTTANSADLRQACGSTTGVNPTNAAYSSYPTAGYHYLQLLEYGATGASFYGDNNNERFQAGAVGWIWG